MASTLDAVPSGIYYSVDSDNFYGMNNHKGQGTEFFARWHDRWNEFPIGRGILPTSFEVWKDNETPSSALSYAALEQQRNGLLETLRTVRAYMLGMPNDVGEGITYQAVVAAIENAERDQ